MSAKPVIAVPGRDTTGPARTMVEPRMPVRQGATAPLPPMPPHRPSRAPCDGHRV